jgi:hypothetical protein
MLQCYYRMLLPDTFVEDAQVAARRMRVDMRLGVVLPSSKLPVSDSSAQTSVGFSHGVHGLLPRPKLSSFVCQTPPAVKTRFQCHIES